MTLNFLHPFCFFALSPVFPPLHCVSKTVVFFTTCATPPPQSLLLVFLFPPLAFHFLTFSASISIAHVRFSVFCFYIFSLFLGTFCVFCFYFVYIQNVASVALLYLIEIGSFSNLVFSFYLFTWMIHIFSCFFKYQAIFQCSYIAPFNRVFSIR